MLWIDRKWYYDTSLEENECMALPFLICLAMYCGYRMFPSANELYRMFLSANELQPPHVLKPILTFPKGRNKLLWFCQRQWDASYPLNIDNTLIIRHNSICPSPTGEVRWGLIWLRWSQMLWIGRIYSVYHHQPPHVLPRRGDADYSESDKPLTTIKQQVYLSLPYGGG